MPHDPRVHKNFPTVFVDIARVVTFIPAPSSFHRSLQLPQPRTMDPTAGHSGVEAEGGDDGFKETPDGCAAERVLAAAALVEAW